MNKSFIDSQFNKTPDIVIVRCLLKPTQTEWRLKKRVCLSRWQNDFFEINNSEKLVVYLRRLNLHFYHISTVINTGQIIGRLAFLYIFEKLCIKNETEENSQNPGFKKLVFLLQKLNSSLLSLGFCKVINTLRLLPHWLIE